MDNSTGNNNTNISGLGLNRLTLSRNCDVKCPAITVDHCSSQNACTFNEGNSISMKQPSSNVGPLTRTLQQIGKFFNSGITSGVSASVISSGATDNAINRTRRESFSRDTLAPMIRSYPIPAPNELISTRDSFGRTYSFTRCASFSRTNSFNIPQQV